MKPRKLRSICRSGVWALVTVAMAAGLVQAEEKGGGSATSNVEVFLTVKPQDPQGKRKNEAPDIEATIIGAPPLDLDKFAIYDQNQKPPVLIKATKLVPYLKGQEPLALALVINGNEIWMGNDDYIPEDDPARHLGVLKGLKQGLQSVPFATAGPAGSKGVLITYGDKAEMRVPMGPLSNITGEALGSQKDYYKKTGTALVQGIELALAKLHEVTASQKVLVVVCDGNDTDNGNAKGQLLNLKKQAIADKVQTFAIMYKGELSDPGNVISIMIPTASTTPSADGITSALTAILARMANRQYLTFPGFDEKVELGFNWDGKEHNMVVKIDKDDAGDPVPLTLSPPWNVPKGASLWWLYFIVIPVGALLLILILVKAFSSKEQPAMPMQQPMMAAPAPMEAPKPAGPMKTVMIGAGGDQDGFPIVGWLVPLNGQNAYQTYRLKPGATKIGTQAPSDIIVNDGFMSTEHCSISCSPAGFMLIDGGSTNGCYVNDRKVAKHDLVDNDTVTLGKTNFKFKSIN